MEHFFQLVWEFLNNVRQGNLAQIIDSIKEHNTVFYAVFFLIIFVETGLVIMPLLPGDSLLFIVGAAIAATGALKLEIAIPLLILAALLGDNVNYFVGKFFGDVIKKRERRLFFKREYLDQTHEFYEKNGGKTVIMARFIPIVRTIAPFVAGAGFGTDVQTFAGAVMSLQERRNVADYDPTNQFRTVHGNQAIDLARIALHHWEAVPDVERRTFLMLLLFPPR